MAQIPTHPELLTPDWLNAQLSAAGLISNGVVTGFSWQPIGTGQVGDSAQIKLVYDREGAGPATLVGKFPAADPTSRQTGAALGLYAKEVGFYRELAARLGARVPHPFVADISDNGADFILLLEDMGPARGGNQLDGCTLADARAAISQAAAFHAPSWNHPEIISVPWLQPLRSQGNSDPDGLYAIAQANFRDRYGDLLEPELMAVCEELNEARDIWAAQRGGSESDPKSVVHGDFRLDNLLFDIKGGMEPIAVLDWQTVTLGNGLTDIGYFLGCGTGDAFRRKHEVELLEHYCSEMTKRGVPLTRDAIWDDYIVGAIHGIVTAVFSAAFVERTSRGDANFLSMARGACGLALQHGSLAKLKERA